VRPDHEEVGVRRGELRGARRPHRCLRVHIATLAGEQAHHQEEVIVVRVDDGMCAHLPIRGERVEDLLHGHRARGGTGALCGAGEEVGQRVE
jgi:hypothetical protein